MTARVRRRYQPYDENNAVLDEEQTFTERQTFAADAAPGVQIERDGANVVLDLYRTDNPGSAGNNGVIRFRSRNDAGSVLNFGQIICNVVDETAATEDTEIRFVTYRNGTGASRWRMRDGLYSEEATGGDPDPGWVNAAGYEIDGTDLFTGDWTWSGDQTLTGVLEMGTTLPSGDGQIKGAASSSVRFALSYGTSTATRYHYEFSNGNGNVGSITTNGSATGFNTSSDPDLKENIVSADPDELLAIINRIKIKQGNWKADGAPFLGVLANELQEVIPEAVTGEPGAYSENWIVVPKKDPTKGWPLRTTRPNAEKEDDRTSVHEALEEAGVDPKDVDAFKTGQQREYQQVDYTKEVPYLIGAVQALSAEITELKSQIAALTAQVGSPLAKSPREGE